MPEQTEKDNVKEQLQLVIFTLENEEFGIEIHQVREIVRLSPITHLPKAPSFIEGVINLRGEVLAVMDLSKRYSLTEQKRTDKTRIIIVEVGNKAIGLIVDSVPEVLRIDIDNIDRAPEVTQSKVQANFIKGVGKVGDRLIVLMNLDEVLSGEEKEALETSDIESEKGGE